MEKREERNTTSTDPINNNRRIEITELIIGVIFTIIFGIVTLSFDIVNAFPEINRDIGILIKSGIFYLATIIILLWGLHLFHKLKIWQMLIAIIIPVIATFIFVISLGNRLLLIDSIIPTLENKLPTIESMQTQLNLLSTAPTVPLPPTDKPMLPSPTPQPYCLDKSWGFIRYYPEIPKLYDSTPITNSESEIIECRSDILDWGIAGTTREDNGKNAIKISYSPSEPLSVIIYRNIDDKYNKNISIEIEQNDVERGCNANIQYCDVDVVIGISKNNPWADRNSEGQFIYHRRLNESDLLLTCSSPGLQYKCKPSIQDDINSAWKLRHHNVWFMTNLFELNVSIDSDTFVPLKKGPFSVSGNDKLWIGYNFRSIGVLRATITFEN